MGWFIYGVILGVGAGTKLTPRIVSILVDLDELEHPATEIWIAI